MGVPVVDAETLTRLLPMEAAIEALGEGFGAERLPETPLRTRLGTAAGDLILMPSAGEQGVGVKLVTLTSANPERGLPLIHAVYVLFDPLTQAPVAMIDGAALTALRTAAVSGLATRHLAREDAGRLAIFGAGVQARSHLEAMRAVRPVREVMIVSRTRERAAALADVALEMGVDAGVGSPDAVSAFDLICTATTGTAPLFAGSLLRPGTHVNAIGAHLPDAREIDTEAVRGARVVVETREAALAEAGELLIPIAEGAIDASHVVADLSEVVRGTTVRTSPDDLTLFKSVGVAFEDLIVARAIVDRL